MTFAHLARGLAATGLAAAGILATVAPAHADTSSSAPTGRITRTLGVGSTGPGSFCIAGVIEGRAIDLDNPAATLMIHVYLDPEGDGAPEFYDALPAAGYPGADSHSFRVAHQYPVGGLVSVAALGVDVNGVPVPGEMTWLQGDHLLDCGAP
jgi:hypothetical protein